MDTTVVRQFFDFFQDFLQLCQAENWPNNNTSETEIKNALLISEHIEKCLNKFQRMNFLNEFLSNVTKDQDLPNSLFKNCFVDPPKYILKKLIQSHTKIKQMDVAFKLFVEIFSEEKLESCLTDIMLETASKQILLKNLSKEIPKDKILMFKSQLLLYELNKCENPKDWLLAMFDECNQESIDLIVVCTINNDIQNHDSVCDIVKSLIEFTKSKNPSHKKFWRLLFSVEERYFVEMCVRHHDWFKIIVKALLDCGKLLQEHMSAEYFYIDLTYSELVSNVQKIYQNDILKVEFYNIASECGSDLKFWENM